MTYTLEFNLYYKGYGEDNIARKALRDYINAKHPRLARFNLHETGAGYEFASGLRDIGYEMKVHNRPILAGTLLRQNCGEKTHRLGKIKMTVKVCKVKP